PHQGSPRVTLRIADRILSVAPRPPVAPISTVRYFSNGTNYDAVLTLPEHPPGVIGYRVEYRRNTPYASWNEWSTWFSTIDTRLRLYGLSAPTTQLRLRAITDFGISVPVNALPPSASHTKRRAVR
ncbi:MAG TPA: hypothetical protein VF787_17385, partial [Thermoanaerobaculia bacterium]